MSRYNVLAVTFAVRRSRFEQREDNLPAVSDLRQSFTAKGCLHVETRTANCKRDRKDMVT